MMLWMKWVKKELDHISATMPRLGMIRGKGKCFMWLLDKDGFLRLISVSFNISDTFDPLASAVRWLGTPSYAGGLRPGGPARLTGVLHYFTRGPDWRIF